MGAFFQLDSHSMVYFMICEIHGFPHQFSKAWENAAKSIELGEPRKLVPVFSLTYEHFSPIRFPSYGILYHMENAWFFSSISNSTEKCSKIHPVSFPQYYFSACSKIYWFLKRKNRKNRSGKLPFLKKGKPIPGTLWLKARYNKRRRGNGCNFTKNKEYKYILGKSMPPFFFKFFLNFNNHLQKLYLLPKNFNEKCSNRGICQEIVPGF